MENAFRLVTFSYVMLWFRIKSTFDVNNCKQLYIEAESQNTNKTDSIKNIKRLKIDLILHNYAMQQPSPQNMPPGMQPTMIPPQPQQPMEKLDNISKVKSLLPPLRESLKNVFSSAANLLNQNNFMCNG